MTTSHRIIVTLEADDSSTDVGTGTPGLLVEARTIPAASPSPRRA
jgi:hypothetical protein